MKSNDSLANWRRVAAGEHAGDAKLAEWLRQRAATIVADVFETAYTRPSERPEAALKAVGWRGRVDPFEELKEVAVADYTQGMSARKVAEAAPLVLDVPGTVEENRRRVADARRKR